MLFHDTITLGTTGIKITSSYDADGRRVLSVLDSTSHDPDDPAEYTAFVDGVERLVLAHFGEGADVSDPAYVAGVDAALDFAANFLL